MEQITTQKKESKGGDFMGKMKMQLTRRKKVLILVGMFTLLAVTGYLNFSLNRGSTQVGGKDFQSSQSFFATFHAQRADERAASISILTSMSAQDSGYSAEIRANAANQLMTLLAAIQYENTTEGLLKAQNFEDAIVMKTNDNINVVIKKEATRDEQSMLVPNILKVIRDQYAQASFGDFDIEKVYVSFMA